MKKFLNTAEVINYTLHELMRKNKNVLTFGLGIDDPKSIFGTTKGLKKKFGNFSLNLATWMKSTFWAEKCGWRFFFGWQP